MQEIRKHLTTTGVLVTAMSLALFVQAGLAEQRGDWLAAVIAQGKTAPEGETLGADAARAGAASAGDVPPGEGEGEVQEPIKLLPVKLSFDYALVTDHVWRGINFSEYRREGTERVNHQFGLAVELDTEDILDAGYMLGTVGASIWFQIYGGNLAISGGRHDHLQQVDYTLYWRNKLEQTATEVKAGWVHRTWPRLHGDPRITNADLETTNEVFVKLTFNDGALIGETEPLLNPYVYYGLDLDITDEGSWIEMGVEPRFALSDYEAFHDSPLLRYMTVAPSARLGIDHRYLHVLAPTASPSFERGQEATRLGTFVYGAKIEYDLSNALGMPEEYGSLKAASFIYFSDALREDILNDELYGGFKIGYSW